jgi:hypothetical protein
LTPPPTRRRGSARRLEQPARNPPVDARAHQRPPVEAQFAGNRPLVAGNHPAGFDQQCDRHRDFQDDERVAPSLPNAIGRSERRERVGVQPARFVERRRETDHDA